MVLRELIYVVALLEAFGLAGSSVSDARTLVKPLGSITFLELEDLDPSAGDIWLSCQTTCLGLLTLEAMAEQVQLELHDEPYSPRALVASTLVNGSQRIDWQVDAGKTYYIRLTGEMPNITVRLVNLVSLIDSKVTVRGTNGEDQFEFCAGESLVIGINQVWYEFDHVENVSVTFNGGAGEDSALLTGSSADETATLWPGRASFGGSDYEVNVTEVNEITVFGEDGNDTAKMYDSAGDDSFVATPTYAKLYGEDFLNRVEFFDAVHAYGAAGGNDVAKLYDSAGNDSFVATPSQSELYGDGFFNRAKFFESVHAYGTAGGNDVAKLYDSAGNDSFVATPSQSELYGDGFFNRAKFFEAVYAYSTAGGSDVAKLYDSPGDERFVATPSEGALFGEGYLVRAVNFSGVDAYANAGGYDVAQLYDSGGDDNFVGRPTYGNLYGDGFYNRAKFFEAVHAYATAGGYDVARLYGSSGEDTFVGTPDYSELYGEGFFNRAKFFDAVYAYGTGDGNDVAELYDSAGDDTFVSTRAYSALCGSEFFNRVEYFSTVHTYGTAGGTDTVSTSEATPVTTPNILVSDAYSVVMFTKTGHGMVVYNDDGTFTYIPKVGFLGQDSFTYTVSDNRGSENTATLRVVVRPEADFDGSGVMDYRDLNVLAEQWLVSGAGRQIIGDLNLDRIVNFEDFAMFLNRWFEGCP